MKELPKHLGGHQNKTHLDVGTLEFFKSTFNIKSMLDIGCGPGGMVNLAQEMDYTLLESMVISLSTVRLRSHLSYMILPQAQHQLTKNLI